MPTDSTQPPESQPPPKVSIIIPAYNAAATLRTAIDSALAQDYERLEVVVVNDGSTDNTGTIAAGYGDRIVFICQPNSGLSAARNAGIAASTGDVIVLLDADDILAPTCVSSRLKLLRDAPDVGLVAGYYREIGQNGALLPRVPERREVGSSPFRQAVRRNWGPPVGWMFWRSVFEEVGGFDPALNCCEDWDFVIRVAAKYTVAYDPEPLALYRRSPNQMTRDFDRTLRGQSRVHAKCRIYARSGFQYFLDRTAGAVQHRRRVLYDLLFSRPRLPMAQRLSCLLRHPDLVGVGVVSVFAWIGGKRASSPEAQSVDWYAPSCATGEASASAADS